MDEDFRRAALDYHRLPRPGKLSIEPTKRMATQRDLGLAYSPGVAAACEEIARNPDMAWEYTARGNMVARGKRTINRWVTAAALAALVTMLFMGGLHWLRLIRT
jgi:malic enzyme